MLSAPPIPTWTLDADRVLATAARTTRLLAAATPERGPTREAIVAAFESGAPRIPHWTYPAVDSVRAAARAVALESFADELQTFDPPPLAELYAARARELALESILAAEVGTERFAQRARLRFIPEGLESAPSLLARAWIDDPEPPPEPDTTTDGNEPESLVSRMRAEIGRHRLPFRVVLAEGLAPLAATGEHTVWVTTGRAIGRTDVERTVVHEIEGHVLPRYRATLRAPGIFAIGTAGGTDDQEGLALVFEARHGFLRGARRRELAFRHRAIEAMDDGATFVEVVRALVSRDSAPLGAAVAATVRAFRGSSGPHPGLGRERVYLSAYTRVSEHLAASPEDEPLFASGQVSVSAVPALRALSP